MSKAFSDLYDLVKYLRGEQGCAWDRKQTLESLRPHLMEEMHEACEAIEENDTAKIREELGDNMFLLLFIARIAEEEGRFSIDDVLTETQAKMKSRHPHIFGEKQDLKPGEVLNQWEKAKQAQKPEGESAFSGLPKGLSGLTKAERIQQRAASLGFDWDAVESAFEKLREEIEEFQEARAGMNPERVKEEMGDILFSLVNVARFLDIRAEDALQGTIEKFRERFGHVEKEIARRGSMTLEEMDEIWERSKGKE